MSKFCEKCGNQLSEEAMFCNKCGAKIQTTDVGQSEAETSNSVPSRDAVQGKPIELNPESLKQKKKIGKKAILISSIVLALVVIIIAGMITVPSLLSSGYPKIIALDEDTGAFDLTFEQFKKGFANCINTVWTASDYSSESITVNDYMDAFNNDDNWYSWNEDDTEKHKWTYQWSEHFSYDITVVVDNDSQKITSISSTSYYPDIITKMILTSYLVYGDKNIDDNFESIYNLMQFIDEYAEEKYYLLNIDNLLVMSYETESYNPTYYYIAATEETLKDYSGTVIKFTHDDLTHFDNALSARYGINYEWQTVENK